MPNPKGEIKMTEQEDRIEKVRNFVQREDLDGASLKLKNRVLDLDNQLSTARQEFQQLQEKFKQVQAATNNKNLEVVALSQRLEGLCDLVLDLDDSEEVVVAEIVTD